MASWVPVQKQLGKNLPLKFDLIAQEYPITPETLPGTPSEILIYTFITLKDALPKTEFKRCYYEIFTRRNDGKEFKFYMNVALTEGTVINSENVFLPYGADFEKAVYVRLIPVPYKKVESSKEQDCATELAGLNNEGVFGEIFITGYKS